MDTARCYWCDREVDELFPLEGARLAGSEPLALPPGMTWRQRLAFLVCFDCCLLFAELRFRRDCEIMEAIGA